MPKASGFIFWGRFQGQDGYLLWIENPEKEYFWATEKQRVPAFRNQEKVIELARQQGIALNTQPPGLCDLDAVATWLHNPAKMPPTASLAVWNAFDDLSHGVEKLFSGNVKALVRNRVFDLLYKMAGPWRSALPVVWPRQERTVLRRILCQGFRL